MRFSLIALTSFFVSCFYSQETSAQPDNLFLRRGPDEAGTNVEDDRVSPPEDTFGKDDAASVQGKREKIRNTPKKLAWTVHCPSEGSE